MVQVDTGGVLYRFADAELNCDTFEVLVAGARVPVEPQVFEVLAFLVRHRDRLVSKEELLDEVWGYDPFSITNTRWLRYCSTATVTCGFLK